jgi:putative FmdB family regulatory protein
MPSYDYRCTACGERFEITRSISDRSAVTCPACSAEASRVFSPVGVLFKGSGFHNTDYRPRPTAPEGDSGSPSPSCGGGDLAACSTCPAAAAAAE